MYLELIIGFSVLIVLVFFLLFLSNKRKKNVNKILVNDEFVENLIKTLGGKDNISSASIDGTRVKISLKDIQIVDLETVQSLGTTGLFISGNNLKANFNQNSEELVKRINDRII